MLAVRPATPRYLHVVDIFELPETMQTWAREWGNRDAEQLDNVDGDYKVALDFRYLGEDLTPDDIVERVLEGELDEADYPYAAWKDHRNDFVEYIDLKRWRDVVRYIAENLPPELVAENKVALYIWH